MRPDYTLTDRDFINPDTIDLYGNTNAHLLTAPPVAFVLEFPGLGGGSCLGGCMDVGPYNGPLSGFLAERGILQVYTFPGPWSWMNMSAVRYVDRIVECACEKYGLDVNTTPIISTGGSMGGHSALNYAKYAKVTPKACFADCPVCDLAFHTYEREDLPRTIYLAFCDYDMPLGDAIKMHSAYHLAPEMPDIPYYIVHGDCDGAVNKKIHSDRFVERMRECGKNVTYVEVEGMEHCQMHRFPEVKEAYESAVIASALN